MSIHVFIGILTTPQLHYIVRCINSNDSLGEPTEEGYYHKLIASFIDLLPKVVYRDQLSHKIKYRHAYYFMCMRVLCSTPHIHILYNRKIWCGIKFGGSTNLLPN